MIEGDEEKTRFTWGVKSLPWLILTNAEHIVHAEGFGLPELEAKVNEIKPAGPKKEHGVSRKVEVGKQAPDFELSRLTIKTNTKGRSVGKVSPEKIRLSSFKSKKPVCLIFSSYT